MNTPIFPQWINRLRVVVGGGLAVVPIYIIAVACYGGAPRTQYVGYMPTQPVPYSHRLHAGQMGMDCRYCHNTVEMAGHAAVPPTETCLGCHKQLVKAQSEKLALVRESGVTDKPIPWVKIHDLPDFAYFNHSVHVNKGMGCSTCHGRIDKMEIVYQDQTLSMGWCLDCHRNPEQYVRPLEHITTMDWDPVRYGAGTQEELGKKLVQEYNIKPNDDCTTCHR